MAVNATTTLKFFAVDTAGNIETVQSRLYTLPLAAVVTGVPAAPTKLTSVSLTVGGAGVTAYKYSIDGGAQSAETLISTKIAKTGLTAGSHTVSVYGKNAAGTWQSTPTTVSWTIDLVKPVTTASLPAGTYGSPQTITLSANETATIYYTTTGVAPTAASPKYTGPVTVTTTTTLKYFAVDAAGNAEAVKSAVYALPPTTLISGVPSGTTAATTATLAVSGDFVTAYKYKLDSGVWSAEIPVAQTRSFVGLESGTHVLSVIGKNVGGTWQDAAAATAAVWTVQ
ncbi:chitobiase/beta-hexosaminidase C-terminal domain-containing protein [Geobacter hydrogenophilus]|nr:chitobiase/beta-hexosaminidase C-terminal domain-containing protein [Geobacter hydrogenophilus]